MSPVRGGGSAVPAAFSVPPLSTVLLSSPQTRHISPVPGIPRDRPDRRPGRRSIAWQAALDRLENPLYIAFHLLCLISVIFVAVRFFQRLPKAQPPTIGPLKPPPAAVIHAMLYVVWIGITVLMTAILAGVLF
jgi:hypothetical protein